MNMLIQRLIRTKPLNFRRSAIEPVGMVAAVSMKTIWKRKKESTATLAPTPMSMKPLPPSRPTWPKRRSGVPNSPAMSPRVVGECAQAAAAPTAG